MEFIDEKLSKKLVFTLLVIVALFLIGISIYLVRSSSGDSVCSYEYNKAIASIDYQTNGDVIINNSVFLQQLSLDTKQFSYYNSYDFCVGGLVSIINPLKFEVYDNEGLIGVNYFSNGNGYHCISIDDNNIVLKDNVIGFKCVNCDSEGNNFTPLISVGTDVISVVDENIVISDQRDYAIKGYLDCSYTAFNLFKYMMLTIVLFALIFLLMLGVTYLKKVAFSGW